MFQVSVAAGKYNQDDPEEKTKFQHEAAKLLSGIREPLERNNYCEAVSREFFMGVKELKDLVEYYGTSGYVQEKPKEQERRPAEVKKEETAAHVAGQ